jgi:hypothetical protein
MIKLRIDVDYPYPSRTKSFLYVGLRIKSTRNKDYLRNARIIAHMINESPKDVKAYWFFTPYTTPDQELLEVLNPKKHEVALHVATNPAKEWKALQEKTQRIIEHYTIHGTTHPIARLIWGRKRGQNQAEIPSDFPLKSFHDFESVSLDTICGQFGMEETKKSISDWIEKGIVISMHPEWLFRDNKKSQKGAYYQALKNMLEVDAELETVSIEKRHGIKVARDFCEYEKTVRPTSILNLKLAARGADIFTFIERKWCCPIANPSSIWKKEDDNIGMLKIADYDSWWDAVGKKTRNLVRKAEKSGVAVTSVEPSDELAKGIWSIYNETPIRQGRGFPHFGESSETVATNMYASKKSTFVAANIGGELVGFVQILYGDDIAIISNILSMQQHQDKSVNNALLAKAVEICAANGNKWLMYGRIGNHPSLDKFKENNGFQKYPLTRFYIPISGKGKLAIRLGLHQELKDALPPSIKDPLIPAFSWASRNMAKLKRILHR